MSGSFFRLGCALAALLFAASSAGAAAGAKTATEPAVVVTTMPPVSVPPLRIIYGCLDPAGGQRRGDRAASGHIEWVREETPLLLALSAWRGTDDAGASNMGTVRLVPPSGQRQWIGIDSFTAVLGKPATGAWSWAPHIAQDGRMRISWYDADASAIAAGLARGATMPSCDAIVLELCFRHVVGGGTAWTAPAGGTFTGLFQVPKGMGLADARKNKDNLLAELPKLDAKPPDAGDIAFDLEVTPAGEWILRIDQGRDGEVETTLTGQSPGCRPSTLKGVNGRSGQVITWMPQGGAKQGQVARLDGVLWHAPTGPRVAAGPGSAAVAGLGPPRIHIAIPATSAVSPVRLRGMHAAGPSTLTLAGLQPETASPLAPGPRAARSIGRTGVVVPIVLDAAKPLPVRISQGAIAVEGSIAWTPTLMPQGRLDLRVLAGDALLIDPGSRTLRWSGPGEGADPGGGGKRPIRFAEPGRHRVHALDAQGAVTGELVVDAYPSDLPPVIAVPPGGRAVPISLMDGIPANQCVVTVVDPSRKSHGSAPALAVTNGIGSVVADASTLVFRFDHVPSHPVQPYHLLYHAPMYGCPDPLIAGLICSFTATCASAGAVAPAPNGRQQQTWTLRMAPWAPGAVLRITPTATDCLITGGAEGGKRLDLSTDRGGPLRIVLDKGIEVGEATFTLTAPVVGNTSVFGAIATMVLEDYERPNLYPVRGKAN